MGWRTRYESEWPRYVPVGERRERARREAQKASKAGRALEPVSISGRTIASTFWGKSWCANLEAYSDYANRLPRGRSYLSNGLVVDLKISAGRVVAQVSGTDLYSITVSIKPLSAAHWKRLRTSCAGRIDSLVELLQGRLADDVMRQVCDRAAGLFPSPREIELECSCPDQATMCKHIAAALYGVGARLDERPELLFTLRGVDSSELVAGAAAAAARPAAPVADRLDGADLEALFGIDLGQTPPPPSADPLFQPGERLTSADLAAIGIPRSTYQNWLTQGVLTRTAERGVYRATARLHERILQVLARNAR